MMDQRNAAEYFIVAWVKNWSLRTYLNVLSEGGPAIDWEAAHQAYPWLPEGRHWFIRNPPCRAYLAKVSRPLSDRLWDATGNQARLALAPQLAALCVKKIKTHKNEASAETTFNHKKMAVHRMHKAIFRDYCERIGGHHWGTVK